MPILIRRSNLMVPITSIQSVREAWRHNADAITLDLEDSVVDTRKVEARRLVQEAISQVGQGAAEVFVRVNRLFVTADIEASVWPGLGGILLPRVESASQVLEAAEILTSIERHRGIVVGSLQLVLLLESARGVWFMREILTASPRITQVGLDESDLAADLGIYAATEFDPFVYARGRLAIEATAAGVQPLGVAPPMGIYPRVLSAEEVLKIATDSRNLGFKGILCPHPSWVEPVNTAFTPTPSQVNYYTQVRQVFAQAVAAGTAAAPFAGRMIDVPVDEWAKVVLAMAAACAARDAEKKAALKRISDQPQVITQSGR
jgi:citrate lyase subunit beta/citryl-CoA lyase